MSAIIYHFPSKPEAKNVARKKLPKARPVNKDVKVTIEVDRLRNYRIFDVTALKFLSLTCWDFHKLIERSDAGEAPTSKELAAIHSTLCSVVRSADCADKFMVMHGNAVNKDDRFNDLHQNYSPAVCNRPLISLEDLEKLLDRL